MSAVGVKYISPLNCSKFVGLHAGQRARRSSISRISLTSCRLFAEQREAINGATCDQLKGCKLSAHLRQIF